MRGSGLVIQTLAALMLLSGLGLTGYALLQPPQEDTTYTLTVEQVDPNEPGVRSGSVEYGNLAGEAKVAFGRAKLGGPHELTDEPPSQLRSNGFVVASDGVYSLTIDEREHITERLAILFGGTTTALIGAFVFVSWLDVV